MYIYFLKRARKARLAFWCSLFHLNDDVQRPQRSGLSRGKVGEEVEQQKLLMKVDKSKPPTGGREAEFGGGLEYGGECL